MGRRERIREETEEEAAERRERERQAGPCELCGREGQELTFHHLIPRHVHKKPRFRDRFGIAEMRSRGLWVCHACHSGIHDLIPDEKVLGWDYNTREALMDHEGIKKHVDWVRKQK